ncbi:mediator of RNA polymerase II transcription subunit 15a-like isoform X2 [Juglans regia]|uniref:Mediator of RNA polymerase II transcription subunit 15a-like isoform X2 n=1 Tax=Juglans regia TaxID=51240 RepID=A0A6P9EB12_JUGRE|nr:mediator of RNA polymerase II transcription subunit 15a-like isoform X2 [Juglans regia]
MEVKDWRDRLSPESRERIVRRIMDILKKQIRSSGRDGLSQIKTLSENFEKKIYESATDENDYLKKISVKLLTVEEKIEKLSQSNSLLSKSYSGETTAPRSIQSQVDKHRQSLSLHSYQSQHQLSRSTQNNIAPCGTSSSLPSSGHPLSDLIETPMPNAATEDSNLQRTSRISQMAAEWSVGHGIYSDVSLNNPIQVQGRKHPPQVVVQQNHQQPQKLQLDSCQLPLQPRLLKPLKNEFVSPSHLQVHGQEGQSGQQNDQKLSRPNQMQSCQLSVTQTPFTRPSETQSCVVSDHLQYRQPSCQQSLQPLLMRHPQRQLQKTHQAPVTHKHKSPMRDQIPSISHQQPQSINQNMADTYVTQNQLIGQQHLVPDSLQQQQRLPFLQNKAQNMQQEPLQGQQNNQSSRHHQQLAQQKDFSVLKPQLKLHGKQCGNYTMHQTQVAAEGHTQKTASALLPPQGQQSQPQLPVRELISQSQLEKVQPPPTPSQPDTMEISEASGPLNLTSEKSFANIGDWQEEVYQRVESLKSRYLKQLNGLRHTLTNRLQQDSAPCPTNTGQLEKINLALNLTIAYLNVPKSKITPSYAEKLDTLQKKILWILQLTGKKSDSSPREGKLFPDIYSVQQLPQPQTQTSEAQQLENHKIPPLQFTKSQSTLAAMQRNNLMFLQHVSKSSSPEPATLHQNTMHLGDHLPASEKGNSVNILQQVAKESLGSPKSISQENLNTLLPISHKNGQQSNVVPLEMSSNTLQNLHMRQTKEQLDVLAQKPELGFQKPNMQQQLVRENHQILPQQAAKPHAHAKRQIQLNEVNEVKVRLGTSVNKSQHQENAVNDSRVKGGMGVKSGRILQNQSGATCSVYSSQHSKPGASVPISSSEVSCHPLAHHCPRIDVQNLPTPLTEAGTCFHSAKSCSALPSSLAQPSMLGNCEKPTFDAPSGLDTGNIRHPHVPGSLGPGQSLAICTPGMSVSPYLEELDTLDGTNCNMPTFNYDQSSVAEQPIKRLINVVNSISSKKLSAAIGDIGSVIGITDWISSSLPANGSRAAIGEDLVAMTKSSLQARYLKGWNDTSGTRKRNRCTDWIASNPSPMNDGFRQWIDLEKPELESSAMSCIKRPRIEVKHALLEEIRKINQQLIDTVVVISDEHTISTAAATGCGEGTIVMCSFTAVAACPNFKSQPVSSQASPIQPLKLLVPASYPHTSPVLLDKMPVGARENHQDLSVKVISKLNSCLRTLSNPFSVGEIARMWDFCVREVVLEYAVQNGGGNFSSKYGTWETCLGAA